MANTAFTWTAFAVCAVALCAMSVGMYTTHAGSCHGSTGHILFLPGLLVGVLAAGILLGRALLMPSGRAAIQVALWVLVLATCSYYFFGRVFECVNV